MVALVEQDKREDALELADSELKRDPFNFGVLFEEAFSLGGDWSDCDRRMRDSSHNYLELAIDYAAAGRYERAIAVLEHYLRARCRATGHAARLLLPGRLQRKTWATVPPRSTSRSSARSCIGRDFFRIAARTLRCCKSAVARLPGDYRAWCDMGNLLYSKRRYDEAIRAWEEARDLASDFAATAPQLGPGIFQPAR